MARNDGESRIKILLACVAISQAPWAYYYFRSEAADELFYITTHTYTFFIVAIMAVAALVAFQRKNQRTFSGAELTIGTLLLLSATFAGTGMGYGLFTDLMDTEIWHGKATVIEYVERYQTESCETDKDGNRDCDCTSHPPEWRIYTNMKGKMGTREISISEEEYAAIAHYWYGNGYISQQQAVGTKGDIGCSQGTIYQINAAPAEKLQIPVSLESEFINYIKASKSVFKVEGSDPALKAIVPPYPRTYNTGNGNIEVNTVLTDTTFKPTDSLTLWMQQVNAEFRRQLMTLGPVVCMNPLVVITQQPVSFGGSIVESWGGLKKNDLLIIISVDPNIPETINQIRCMSLTKNKMFTAELEGVFSHMKQFPDAQSFVNIVMAQAQATGDSGFDRLHDAEARYLLSDVHLALWAYFVIGLIALLCSTPLALFFVND